MPEKVIPTSFDVQLYGDLEPYSPTISKARVRIFYRGLNRNSSYISEEFAEKLIKTLPYSPVKGIYDVNEDDFTDHGSLSSIGKAYGVIPENNNGEWERHIDTDGIERTYYCSDVLLWTSLYEEAKKIPGKCESMELFRPSIQGAWKEFEGGFFGYEFTEGCFLGLQVLGTIDGEKVEPCFEGSAFYTKDDTQLQELKEQFSEIIEVAKNYNLQKEEPTLENTVVNSVIEKDVANAELNQSIENGQVGTENTTEPATNSELNKGTETNTGAPETNSALEGGENTGVQATEPQTNASLDEGAKGTTEFAALNSQVTELNEKFAKLSDEFSVLTEKYNHLKAERDALKEFKDAAEAKEKNQVLEKYAAILSEDTIKEYKEKLDSYTVVELNKELCFEAHKDDVLEPQTTNFSYKNTGEEKSAIEAYLNDYRIN